MKEILFDYDKTELTILSIKINPFIYYSSTTSFEKNIIKIIPSDIFQSNQFVFNQEKNIKLMLNCWLESYNFHSFIESPHCVRNEFEDKVLIN